MDGVEDLADSIENSTNDALSGVRISALVLGDRVKYPRRLFSEDSDVDEGELSGFDEAYDFAMDILDTDTLEIEKNDKYVSFISTD